MSSICGSNYIRLLPDPEEISALYVPPSRRVRKRLVNVSDHFPMLEGVQIPMLEANNEFFMETLQKRTKMIRTALTLEAHAMEWIPSFLQSAISTSEEALTDLWRCCLENQLSLLTYQVESKVPGTRLQTRVHFGESEMRPGMHPINVIVDLERVAPTSSRCRLLRITFDNGKHQSKPGDADWNMALNIATCAASTHMTFREHFLSCHLLTVGTWHSIAHVTLSPEHPIGIFIANHSLGINPTNVYKGQPLLDDSFSQDFTLTEKGLVQYLSQGVTQFNLWNLEPTTRMKNQGFSEAGTGRGALPFWDDCIATYSVLAKYAQRWVKATYQSEQELQADRELRTFWRKLTSYAFMTSLGPLTSETLSRALAVFAWVSVVLHDIVGDEVNTFVKSSELLVPIDPSDREMRIKQRLAKMFFNFVFLVATRTIAVKLLSQEWVLWLSEPYRGIAKKLQRDMIHLGKNSLELGTNK